MLTRERFQLALRQIEGAQWRKFETLSTVFLADEYPSLRPLAAASGDGGLDAMLFRPEGDVTTALQFSVRKDWASKIRETCARVRETTKTAQVLIFATNQEIGPAAGALKRQMREQYELFVDVRDLEWFITHRNSSSASQAEAEEFCRAIVDPFLQNSGAIERQAQALEDLEAKAAFVYLGLQWQDDTREKGLTKLCFDAIVRAVLRETTSENRMPRAQVKALVGKLLPAHDSGQLSVQVDSALTRLSKVFIRHSQQQDEFCLTWDERQRLMNRLAAMESMDDTLRTYLGMLLKRVADETDRRFSSTDDLDVAIERSRAVLERVLLDRGEAFASSVVNDRGPDLSLEDVEALVYSDLATTPRKSDLDPRVIASALMTLLVEPPEEVRAYLRSLADTYTLFAFLRETPDVQSAVVKIFSEGDIWLDASVVLPLFAEELLAEPMRSHGLMLRAAVEAGLNLFVTPGVVQELATHINRCRGYFHALDRGDAHGSEPFLLASYRLSGRDASAFESWLETFAGLNRAEADVADYLEEYFDIREESLEHYADQADPVLRAMVGEIWHEARDLRDEKRTRLGAPPMDPNTKNLLVSHDVENYVGAQMRRLARNEKRSAFGFKTWWLTLDGTAFKVKNRLVDRIEARPMESPAISPDFMLNYLAIGPVRMRLSKKTEEALPLMLNMSILDAVPKELVDLSDELRRELAGLPSHVVRRKIRDALDDARLLLGARAAAGEEGLTEEIKQRLIQQAKLR